MSQMITCPDCKRHVHQGGDGSAFACPMCGESIDPAGTSSSRGLWIAVGVGVVVAAAAVAYIALADDEVEEKFQPAYGTPVTGDVIF